MDFSNLGLSKPILDRIAELGYQSPTPIQRKAIPVILDGRDLMAAAQTGTGKTAAFGLAIIERLALEPRAGGQRPRALVLAPTRELACQISGNISSFCAKIGLQTAVVYGGVPIETQFAALRHGVDILVATPGRLLDLHRRNAIHLQRLEFLVLDEADRMLDMGFIEEIRLIIALLPKNRQNLMFTATFSDGVRKFAKTLVRNPVEISIDPESRTAKTIVQLVLPVDKKKKTAALTKLILDGQWRRVLVFVNTKDGADTLTQELVDAGIKAVAIHSNKPQQARTKSLTRFKAGTIHVLVATDIAARGIDIDELPQVINFELPNSPADYVHRIGRTGRAGLTGEAISLVCTNEHGRLVAIEQLTKTVIPRQFIEGFIPLHPVPLTVLDKIPKSTSKVKKASVAIPKKVQNVKAARKREDLKKQDPGKSAKRSPAKTRDRPINKNSGTKSAKKTAKRKKINRRAKHGAY